jgi:hypothetical protein
MPPRDIGNSPFLWVQNQKKRAANGQQERNRRMNWRMNWRMSWGTSSNM